MVVLNAEHMGRNHLGELEQIVLLAILRVSPDAYGVPIRTEIEQRTRRSLTEGALDRPLDRLEEKGYVTSWFGDPTPERGGCGPAARRSSRCGMGLSPGCPVPSEPPAGCGGSSASRVVACRKPSSATSRKSSLAPSFVASEGTPRGTQRDFGGRTARHPTAILPRSSGRARNLHGGTEGVRGPDADGHIAHAVVLFGPAMVMIESEWAQATNRAPAPDGTTPVAIYLYVADVDRIVERAVAVGARVISPPADRFWGDRTAWILDPAGHVWTLATRLEETTEEERQARLARLNRSAQ